MKKIPTLFVRNPADMSRVLNAVNPACQWVIDGEGVATRKWDGTCMMLDGARRWWARREVRPGKTPPDNYRVEEQDPVTGKTVGWEPAEQSGFVKYLFEAITRRLPEKHEPGTYELCGPKINGNPEHMFNHTLINHADQELAPIPAPRTYGGLLWLFQESFQHEGIVWHHPDGRMAKLKVRDFPQEKDAS